MDNTQNTGIRLTDLARQAGGWPIDLEAVGVLLERADKALSGGRDYVEPLTEEQLTALGYVPA